MRTFVTVLTLILTPALLPGWQTPAFEVAEIKPSDPSVQKTGKGRMLPGGRIELPGQTVRDLMTFAYAVQDDMIMGGPKWASEERFDIVAKALSDGAGDAALDDAIAPGGAIPVDDAQPGQAYLRLCVDARQDAAEHSRKRG